MVCLKRVARIRIVYDDLERTDTSSSLLSLPHAGWQLEGESMCVLGRRIEESL